MTRIIAGAAGSLPLQVPPHGTRPTSDRVRESLFASLEAADEITDAAVLDLYAGSGALGLEALSRGAAGVDLVERSAAAARIATRNAASVERALGVSGAARVHTAAVDAYLRTASARFTLVMLDPPYELADDELAATLALLPPLLADDALVVIERASRSAEPVLPAGLTIERDRRYGDTRMWWVRGS